ncbi:hypothetical protein IKG38_02115 [Candidatus Saccharibacteria bacterium]|nr:hypothetical protein [Candidatus Saccharibacteria bacterium]
MQTINPIIPASYDYLFDIVAEKLFAEYLVRYILFDEKPIATPALWQDAVIYIRFRQRDVWSLNEEQIKNAKYAILIYEVIYTTEHLKKPDILKILNQFFAQTPEKHKGIFELFEQKFHASLDSFIFTQEKLIVTKEMADNLSQLFAYPCWLDFTDEANQLIFDKILQDKLSDEQIDYFLGASDDIAHYDQWFKVAKHILKTTHGSHVFWTAGDILSIIWKAAPQDAKSQKWFRDEVFDIFWPRVNSIWPLLNEDKIDFDYDEDSRILKDSIGWLQVLDDLNERLPELSTDYATFKHDTDPDEFAHHESILLEKLDSNDKNLEELLNLFFILTNYVYDDDSASKLQTIAEEKLIPFAESSPDAPANAVKLVRRAIKHAKTYVANLARERENIVKNLINRNS